jgi:hypothetical protein
MNNYRAERIYTICRKDDTECKHKGKCDTCEKTKRERTINEKSADFKAGYQQALDDIRWRRCKYKNYEYHARARSQEDRLDEIRALDKELIGGGNTDQR